MKITENRYELYQGDCLEVMDRLIKQNVKVDMVLTDPPYNVNVEETAGKIKNDNMADEDFYK